MSGGFATAAQKDHTAAARVKTVTASPRLAARGARRGPRAVGRSRVVARVWTESHLRQPDVRRAFAGKHQHQSVDPLDESGRVVELTAFRQQRLVEEDVTPVG